VNYCVICCFAELWISVTCCFADFRDSDDRVILVISVIRENERQQVATRPIMADESPFGISDRETKARSGLAMVDER
jgi:hypothetical protein